MSGFRRVVVSLLSLVLTLGVAEAQIITNGDFETGTIAPWSASGAAATVQSGPTSQEARIVMPGTLAKVIQFFQPNLTLEPGTEYRLAFDARSVQGGSVIVQLIRPTPFANYGLNQTVALVAPDNHYEILFTPSRPGAEGNATITDARFRFRLDPWNAIGEIYFFDNVSIVEAGAAICGDDVLDTGAGEECDDGNLVDGDGCQSNCLLPTCGDGIVDASEACDTAGATAGCDDDCTAVACGDSNLNVAAGEECDDGNLVDGDGCQSTCLLPLCGDGVVDPGEACDAPGEAASCDDDCSAVVCGDNNVNQVAGEQCDDGNLTDGDGCDGDCTVTVAAGGSPAASDAVVYVSDFEGCPAPGDPTPGTPCTDMDIWRMALDAARDGSTLRTVVGEGKRLYRFDDTLEISGLQHGIINGNGAGFHWETLMNGVATPAPNDRPMFRVANCKRLRIQNMDIRINVGMLQTAFEFTNVHGVGHSATRNELHHIAVQSAASARLDYGVRFVEAEPDAVNNDQATISHCAFNGVWNAAISIEGKESLNHRFINVSAGGGPSQQATSSAFVRVTKGGSFTSIGGFVGGFTEANYVIHNSSQRILIIDSNSEKSARFIKAFESPMAEVPNSARFANAVSVLGGRFAVDFVAQDGYVIDFTLRGPLVVDGLVLDGITRNTSILEVDPNTVPPTDSKIPRLRFEPGGDGVGISVLQVTGTNFYWTGKDLGSEDYDPIVLGDNARLIAYGNMCRAGSASGNAGQSVECKIGYGGGIYSASGVTFQELNGLNPRPGHWTYCSDCSRTSTCQPAGGDGAFAMRLRVGGADQWVCD